MSLGSVVFFNYKKNNILKIIKILQISEFIFIKIDKVGCLICLFYTFNLKMKFLNKNYKIDRAKQAI